GEQRIPIMGSSRPVPDSERLTASDVTTIFNHSIARALRTRAAIRNPIGVPARMQVAVTDLDGSVLGEFRMNDATMFSFDIVIQKGRTVTSFSDPTQTLGQQVRTMLNLPANNAFAFTPRSLEFIAQPFYPPGIDGTLHGPLY